MFRSFQLKQIFFSFLFYFYILMLTLQLLIEIRNFLQKIASFYTINFDMFAPTISNCTCCTFGTVDVLLKIQRVQYLRLCNQLSGFYRSY
jgi:hypothetical protein